MLAVTSDQLGQPRQINATSRPTRLQGATEEQIPAFFSQVHASRNALRASARQQAMTPSALGEMGPRIEATTASR